MIILVSPIILFNKFLRTWRHTNVHRSLLFQKRKVSGPTFRVSVKCLRLAECEWREREKGREEGKRIEESREQLITTFRGEFIDKELQESRIILQREIYVLKLLIRLFTCRWKQAACRGASYIWLESFASAWHLDAFPSSLQARKVSPFPFSPSCRHLSPLRTCINNPGLATLPKMSSS